MIRDETINGRACMVAYLTHGMVPTTPEKATLLKVVFKDNSERLFLEPDKTIGKRLQAKTKKKGVALPVVSADRLKARMIEKQMRKVVQAYFDDIKPGIIRQVTTAYALMRKADPTDDIMSQIDFSVRKGFTDKMQTLLKDMYEDAGHKAIDNVAIGTASRAGAPEVSPHAFNQISETAVRYAEQRSAEMVGMKYVGDKLVPNPDAKWQITEATREGVRGYVAAAVKGELPVTELADTLRQSYAFSEARAEMIARTEMRFANGNGALNGYKASGVVELKVWLTSNDADVSDDCQENEDDGPIPLDDAFASGDDCEPAHPNCRCAVAPYIEFPEDDSEGTD